MVDRNSFAEIMQFVALTLKGEELNDKELLAYYFALADEFSDIEEFKKVVKKVIKNWKYGYFPKPNHFIESKKEFSDLDIEIIAQKAWKSVIEALKKGVGYNKSAEFEDKLIPPVVELCGGFKRLATKTFEELEWIKKEFLKTYKAAIEGEIKLEAKEVLPMLEEAKRIKIKANYPVLSRKIIETPAIENKANTLVKSLANAKRI